MAAMEEFLIASSFLEICSILGSWLCGVCHNWSTWRAWNAAYGIRWFCVQLHISRSGAPLWSDADSDSLVRFFYLDGEPAQSLELEGRSLVKFGGSSGSAKNT